MGAEKAGFYLSLKAAYLFVIDTGSSYVEGYSSHDEAIGAAEVSVLVGIAL